MPRCPGRTDAAIRCETRPSGVMGVTGDQQAVISWSKSSSDGGSPVIGHTVISSPGGVSKDVSADDTSATLTGLSNGTAYTFTVVATNTVGDSPASESSNTVTPAGEPLTPTAPTAVRGDRQPSVSWTARNAVGTSPYSNWIKVRIR